jgi:hypothetical protein
MGTVVGLVALAAFVWWVFKGRESTAALVNNLLLALLFGGGGVLLVVPGSGAWNVLLGLACVAYAARGLALTAPWLHERLDPDGR